MSKTYTVHDSSEIRTYSNIRKVPHNLAVDRSEKVVLVAEEDTFELWAIAPGGFAELLRYYEIERPNIVVNGILPCLILHL